jgi:fructokinase
VRTPSTSAVSSSTSLGGSIGGDHILSGVILCLGEAIVDLICEKPVSSMEDADEFRPHFGGALANVAVWARRAGADAALAGGVGDDDWGGWLRAHLEREGVDLSWFELVDDAQTPIAFAFLYPDGEPQFEVYGQGIEDGLRAVAGQLDDALDAASALVFGSNTMISEPGRAVTLHARREAIARGVPVMFDPNLRLNRWRDLDLAREVCRSVCHDAFCVRSNLDEARFITGADDPAEAAEELCGLGARLAVVGLGSGGAMIRGEAIGETPGIKANTLSTLGAGDAFMGTFAAGLAAVGWNAALAAEALPAAVEAGARACEHWGAHP